MAGTTVICVLRSGGCYGSDYVARLQAMCERHLPSLTRFVCLTDRRVSCESIPMRYQFPAKWSKIEVFDPALPLEGRVLYLDLDVIVQGSLEPFIRVNADFAIAPGGPTRPKPGRVGHYNSSVMVFNARARPQIFEHFTRDVMDRLVGDQDWIGEVCPAEHRFPSDWIEKYRAERTPAAPLVLCNKPKPHELTDRAFVRRHWQGLTAPRNHAR